MESVNANILFEISWEVCNKVGGIYTVLTSKVNLTKHHYKIYYLIGPYIEGKAKGEFEEISFPNNLKVVYDNLKKQGIIIHFGKWLIKGEPFCFLIEPKELWDKKDELKRDLWSNYKIDSLNTGFDYDEPLIWATAAGKFLEEYEKANKEKIVAQFHEWLSGFGLLHLKKVKSKIATVFTTHATMLGRTLAGNGIDLYNRLDKIDPEKEAYKFNVQSKFLVERACAKFCDVFTTVSEITSLEAEKILGRKADVLTVNGLEIQKFPTIEESSIKHITCRDIIRDFLTYFFHPYYTFDLKENLIFYIIGRDEYSNKGIDIFIEALGSLNKRLKKEESLKTISAFFWIPKQNYGVKSELLENKNYYRYIRNYIYFNQNSILNSIVNDLVSHGSITKDSLFSKDFIGNIKKELLLFNRKSDPLLCTHILDESNDPIIKGFREAGLNNKKEDKVKVILYPIYLSGNDGLIGLNYYDAMAGCHLGVFPSYYEPYGYTPLESAALGVPSITSDLSGFGKFIYPYVKNKKLSGIFVLKRAGIKREDIINQFTDYLYRFLKQSKNDRIQLKTEAKGLSELADWKVQISNYIKAHNLALKKISTG